MIVKNIKFLFLGLALPIVTSSCFSTEEKNLAEKEAAQHVISPVKLLEQAADLYRFTCNQMKKNSLDQATSFGKVVSLVDLAIPHLEDDILATPKELKALSLKQQAVTLHNYVCNNYMSTRDSSSSLQNRVKNNASLSLGSYDFLKEAVAAIRKSCRLYKELNHIRSHKDALDHLGVILLAFSENCAIKADAEEDHDTALSLFIESVDCLQESKVVNPMMAVSEDLSPMLSLSLKKTLDIYTNTNGQFLQLCQSTDLTMQHYGRLIANANLTRKILDYLNKYIMDSSLDFIVVMEAGPKEISRSKGNTRGRGHKGRGGRASSSTAYLSPTGKNVPPVLNPRDFIVLPWTTYCGALQSASLTMNALSTQCIPQLTQAYGQKAQNHAADAFNFYKENVYQGEYAKDSKVEKAFIEARLADIIGNPTPLSEFYKQLRQRRQDEQHEKLVEMIKAEQEAQGQREEKHRQKSTKESQQKASKILLEGEDTDTPVLVSPIEAVSISINRPSVVAELSPETRPKKEKIKTRGIAKPQSVSSLKDTLILEEERKKVGLSSDDHHVFHSLTGGIFDRGISLDRVKKLLTSSALGCKISTGGSHPGKATAPNGKMWTIPSPWEGPIPHYYRQQLNDFLQSAMDIDPDNVV